MSRMFWNKITTGQAEDKKDYESDYMPNAANVTFRKHCLFQCTKKMRDCMLPLMSFQINTYMNKS